MANEMNINIKYNFINIIQNFNKSFNKNVQH